MRDKTITAYSAEIAEQQANLTEAALNEAKEAAYMLDRFLGTFQTYGGIPVKPQMSIGVLTQIDNYNRKAS